MQYEIYVDQLFVMNMFFDCLMLFATRHILKLKTSSLRITVAGGIGSLGLCSVFILPFQNALSRMIFLMFFVFPLILVIAFYKNSWKRHIQAGIVFLSVSVICGKIVEYIYMGLTKSFQMKMNGIFICVVGALSMYLIKIVRKLYIELQEETNRYYTVLMRYGEKEILVDALFDTGNLLRDPITGKYVHIIDKEISESLLGKGEKVSLSQCGIRLIPYKTITKSGVIPAFTITEMLVSNGIEEKSIKSPMIGISSETISSSQKYQMILNSGELK